jgi:vacuolar-type H+-ATPase subunit H
MSKTDGQVKKNKVQELIPPSDGQDGGLMAFINSLIDQNAELAAKLENMDSLMELAEKTVIEAGKEAEAMRAEAENEANARAAAIVARAVEKAKAAAQKIIARAKEKAEAEAQRIIAEAKQKAEHQAQEITKAADEKGSQIIAEALNKAEAEALLIKKEAEQLRESRRKTDECQRKNPWDIPDQLFMEQLVAPETKTESKVENKSPEPPASDDALSTAPTSSVEKPVEQPTHSKEDKKESPASYDEVIDLALLPPLSLDQMLRLHKHLKKNSRVKVVELKGSLDKGVTIRILVQAHTPILNMLAVLPEVEKVSDEPVEVGKASSAHRKGNGPTPRTIAVSMKR